MTKCINFIITVIVAIIIYIFQHVTKVGYWLLAESTEAINEPVHEISNNVAFLHV